MILPEMTVFNWPKGGVAFLVKNGQVLNKEYRYDEFNIITDNKALAIDLEHSNNQNLTFHFFKPSTIYLTMSCLSEISTRN